MDKFIPPLYSYGTGQELESITLFDIIDEIALRKPISVNCQLSPEHLDYVNPSCKGVDCPKCIFNVENLNSLKNISKKQKLKNILG